MLYSLIKFIHVAGAIIWIGSIASMSFLNLRIAQTKDIAGLTFLSKYGVFLGKYVVSPSAIITVLAGASLSLFFGFGWPFWVIWGLAVILLTGIFEGNIARKLGARINMIVQQDQIDYQHLNTLQRKYSFWNLIAVLLLFSVVWVMVFKPTL